MERSLVLQTGTCGIVTHLLHHKNIMNKMNTQTLKTFDILSEEGIIPSSGNFDVSEEMLNLFSSTYCSLNKSCYVQTASVSRRYAGICLINLKLSRNIKPKDIKDGFVYLITNPAWEEYTKVGISVDIYRRLASYQTSDPLRAYKITGYEYVLDRKSSEKKIHDDFGVVDGEWVKNSSSLEIIRSLRNQLDVKPLYAGHLDKFGNVIYTGDLVGFLSAKGTTANKGFVLEIKGKSILIRCKVRSKNDGIRDINIFPSEAVLLDPSRDISYKKIKRLLS